LQILNEMKQGSVSVSPQALSEEQKAQARANIDAANVFSTADVSSFYFELWERKGLSSSGGNTPDTFFAPATNRCAIAKPIELTHPMTVSCDDEYSWRYQLWNDAEGNGRTYDSGWLTVPATIEAGAFVTLLVTKGGATVYPGEVARAVHMVSEKSQAEYAAQVYGTVDDVATLRRKPACPVVRAINHRGYNTEAPENTLAAYRLSKAKGFDIVECDVSLTADGVPVLLHDDTVDRTSDGSGKISELTFEEVRALDFGDGEQIPTLEEFLLLCRSLGLQAYLDLRVNDAELITGIVKKCGMTGHVTFLASTISALEAIKNVMPKARLAYTSGDCLDKIDELLALRTGENEVIIDCEYTLAKEELVTACATVDLPIEVWTINLVDPLMRLNPYVTGVTSDKLLAWQVLAENYSGVVG